MHNLTVIVVAATLGSAAVAGFTPASARMSLSQCISNNGRCEMRCYLNSPVPPGLESRDLNLKNCLNQCSGNHAGCVDRAMTMSAKPVDPQDKPPRKSLGVVIPSGGLLDAHSGFTPHGPAATGSPVSAPAPAAPSAPPVIIR